jgi:hypothetical protein
MGSYETSTPGDEYFHLSSSFMIGFGIQGSSIPPALLPVTPTVPVGMTVMTMVVWSPKMKGKSGDNRPSPPAIIIGGWRWGRGVIPDHWGGGTTDFFERFLYQISILPNPFSNPPAIGVIGPFRNGLNGMSALVIINNWLVIVCCISGCLVILIYRVADQGTKNGSCGHSNQGAFGITSDSLPNEGTRTGPYGGPLLGVVAVGWNSSAGKKKKGQGQCPYDSMIYSHDLPPENSLNICQQP